MRWCMETKEHVTPAVWKHGCSAFLPIVSVNFTPNFLLFPFSGGCRWMSFPFSNCPNWIIEIMKHKNDYYFCSGDACSIIFFLFSFVFRPQVQVGGYRCRKIEGKLGRVGCSYMLVDVFLEQFEWENWSWCCIGVCILSTSGDKLYMLSRNP